MDEVAAGAVLAEAAVGVERAAGLGLVLGVAVSLSDFVVSVRELALVAVLARFVLLERAANLGFVASLVHERFQGSLEVVPFEVDIREGSGGVLRE